MFKNFLFVLALLLPQYGYATGGQLTGLTVNVNFGISPKGKVEFKAGNIRKPLFKGK